MFQDGQQKRALKKGNKEIEKETDTEADKESDSESIKESGNRSYWRSPVIVPENERAENTRRAVKKAA